MTDNNYSGNSYSSGRQSYENNKKLSLKYVREFLRNQVPEQLFSIHYALGNREDPTPSILVRFDEVKPEKIREISSLLENKLKHVTGDNVLGSAIRINGKPADIIKTLKETDPDGLSQVRQALSNQFWVLK